MKRVALISTLFLSISIAFWSCEPNEEFENSSKTGVAIDMTGDVIQGNLDCLVHDESNPSNKYTRIDSARVYGFMVDYFLPDSLKVSDLKLVFSGKMRETESITSGISIALSDVNDSLTYWGLINAANHVKEANKWFSFKDSVTIPAGMNTIKTKKLRLFPSKSKGKGFFDVDDLKIEVKIQ